MKPHRRFNVTPLGGTWQDLWISAAGGLAAAGAAGLLGFIPAHTYEEWLHLTIPAWMVFLGTALVVTVLIWVRRTFGRRQVLVVLSAFKQHSYFSELFRQVIVKLESHPKPVDTVLKVPSRQYTELEQHGFLEEGVRRKASYRGALIVPIDRTEEDLKQFVHRFAQPVVFVDTAPWEDHSYPPNSCFVGVDGEEGGRKAADAMVHELGKVAGLDGSLRLLVITGGYHEERETAFQQRIAELLPSAQVSCCQQAAHFLRSEARELAEPLLEAAEAKSAPYHGVFCTGDEMALGVLDAVSKTDGRGVHPDWVLIGYDAIPEAQRIIEDDTTPFKNTIVQDPEVLAARALYCLEELHQGKLTDPIIEVPAELHSVIPHQLSPATS